MPLIAPWNCRRSAFLSFSLLHETVTACVLMGWFALHTGVLPALTTWTCLLVYGSMHNGKRFWYFDFMVTKKKNQQKGCHGHLVHVVWSGETVALASVQRIHWYCFASFFNYISPNILTQSHKYTHGLLKAMPRKTSFANIDNWTFEEILIFWVSKNSPLCCTCGIFASEHEVR